MHGLVDIRKGPQWPHARSPDTNTCHPLRMEVRLRPSIPSLDLWHPAIRQQGLIAIRHHKKRMRKLRGVQHKDTLIRALGIKVDEQKISAFPQWVILGRDLTVDVA
jgi:hypothetical protein